RKDVRLPRLRGRATGRLPGARGLRGHPGRYLREPLALFVAGGLRLRVQGVDGCAAAGRRARAAAQAGAADVAGDAEVGEDLRLDLLGGVRVLAQELLGVLASLADAVS